MCSSYFLAPHVHLCVAGKHVVLLDLEQDKYLVFAQTHSIGQLVQGWPAIPGTQRMVAGQETTHAPTEAALSVAEQRILGKLLARRILVTDPVVGKVAKLVVTDEVKMALVEPQLLERPDATFGHFWRLLWAYWVAKWALRRRSIKEVVEGVRARKIQASAAAEPLNVDTVRTLVAAFLFLRPIFYTAHNACVLDSFTLTRFLALYGIFPDWVFGVKPEPFHAHCWVQQGGCVFNDSPDLVREFSPILAV